MSEDARSIRRRLSGLSDELIASGAPVDVLGRLLVQQAVELWKRERDWADIARELQHTAESLDPDTDYTFMRP